MLFCVHGSYTVASYFRIGRTIMVYTSTIGFMGHTLEFRYRMAWLWLRPLLLIQNDLVDMCVRQQLALLCTPR